MNSVLRARTIGETCGFMKALIDARSDRILGFTMLGSGAGEVVAAVARVRSRLPLLFATCISSTLFQTCSDP
jgi:pyruvate/2-oxoglutarate dehydrogenase complex dihydrolipoamide dehydrogenase (E3) component